MLPTTSCEIQKPICQAYLRRAKNAYTCHYSIKNEQRFLLTERRKEVRLFGAFGKEDIMEDDSDLGCMSALRAWTKELIDACTDADLLDFVYKMLLNG